MSCTVGSTLYEQYQAAEQKKLAVKAKQFASPGPTGTSARDASGAKQEYIEKYADWLGHRAFCHDCKPKG